MRTQLLDILRQSGSLFTMLKITGTPTSTKVNAVDESKTLIFEANLKTPIPEFEGIFGISNLNLLNGLLNFTSFKTDAATFSAQRRVMGGTETVEQFLFTDGKKSKGDFRLTAPSFIPEVTELAKQPPYDAVFTPDKAKLAEFDQLSTLYSSVEPSFVARTDDQDLIFMVGNENSSTHRASMVIHEGEGVTGKITGDLRYSTSHFKSVMKLAGSNPVQVHISSRGIMKINVDTEYGTYDYYLRSSRG